MSATILSTEERLRRHQRDLRAYRQRSLWRRSHARFERDLAVHPHLFLAPGLVRAGALIEVWQTVVEALRGEVVWTLDTAARLVCGVGILATPDLTGYMSRATLDRAVADGLIEPPRSTAIGLAPVAARPPMLVAHHDEPPPGRDRATFTLSGGDCVVTWQILMQDLKGTLGWRPDLLTRLEDTYFRVEESTCV